MKHLQLEERGNVFILTISTTVKDNLFNFEVIDDYIEAFDIIEASSGNKSLVLRSTHEKNFQTDLEWLNGSGMSFEEFGKHYFYFNYRAALLNLPTIGCISGNVYAGGAVLAACFDFRYMREDRGRFCFSEVDVGVPFPLEAIPIIKLLPNPHALRDMVYKGVAWGGVECYPKNIVDAIYPKDILFEKSMEFAQEMAKKDRKTYTAIKRNMRHEIVELMEEG